MTKIAVIPARMSSSRFPGKPMTLILGKPMIEHVYRRVNQCMDVDETIVATCDSEIFDFIKSVGGKAVMTSDKHERASDRCAEAVLKYEEEQNAKTEIVVMVQGDEPMTNPEMLTQALRPMIEDPSIPVVNLLGNIANTAEFEDRNCIKVVTDLHSNALFFSREPIPTRLYSNDIPMGKQVCVIPFRRSFLLEYADMTPTPLEIAESIDMMRILEHGGKVKMVPTQFSTHAVDHPSDVEIVERALRAESEN